MRRALLLAASLAALVIAVSGDALALDGRIIESDGTPVIDASLSVLGHPGAARTNGAGRFQWLPDPATPFRFFVVRSDGRAAPPVLIETLEAGSLLIVRLEPRSAETITVTAAAAPHTEAPPAAGVSLMAREDLQRRHPARIADALENVPGAGKVGQGHDAVPSLRGLARGRTLILLDGARLSTERRAGPSGGLLNPFFLETLEVSRGPGAVAYGSDAFGGVIHGRSRQPERGAPAAIRFTGSLGSGLPERGAGVEYSRPVLEGGILVSAAGRYFGDYRSPGMTVDGSSAKDTGLLVRFDHEAGPGNLTVGWLSALGRDVERATDGTSSLRISQPFDDAHRLTIAYDMDPRVGGELISFHGFAGGSRLLTRQQVDPGGGLSPEISSSDVRASDYGARARLVKPVGRARIEAGIDLNGRFGMHAEGDVAGVRNTSIRDASRSDTAAYFSAEAPVRDRLTVATGMRADRVAAENHGGYFGDRSDTKSALSGFGSATLALFPGSSLTLQVSRGFRDPSLSDRYFRGVSGRGFVEGNPDLDAEQSLQFDAAARWTGARAQAALYGYDYRISDLIERFAAGQDSVGRDLFFFRNRGQARLQGIEVEVRADLPAKVMLELSAQISRGENDAGESLDDIPPGNFTVLASRPVASRGSVWLRTALVDRDDAPGPTERIVPGHALFDAGGSIRFGERADVRLTLRNMFDRDLPASPDSRAPRAPGLSALATVTFRLPG